MTSGEPIGLSNTTRHTKAQRESSLVASNASMCRRDLLKLGVNQRGGDPGAQRTVENTTHEASIFIFSPNIDFLTAAFLKKRFV
jgi:hypothetical protein